MRLVQVETSGHVLAVDRGRLRGLVAVGWKVKDDEGARHGCSMVTSVEGQHPHRHVGLFAEVDHTHDRSRAIRRSQLNGPLSRQRPHVGTVMPPTGRYAALPLMDRLASDRRIWGKRVPRRPLMPGALSQSWWQARRGTPGAGRKVTS